MNGRKKVSPVKKAERKREPEGSPSKQWYLFYLWPKAEKSVFNELRKRGYEVFYPTYRAQREWRNRQKKVIELPLFPNYLFVRTYQHELYTIKCLPRIVTYISSEGKPSVISEREIEGIRRMIRLEKKITVEAKFCEGEHVRISTGPLAGYDGILVRKNGKSRFGIVLKTINQTAFIDIDASALEKTDPDL